MSTAIAVRHQLSPPGGSSDTIVPNVTVSNSGAINSKMPHTNHNAGAAAASSAAPSSPGDDFGSTDEVKVFKDEGDKEDEQSSGENLLLEEKSSLIDLTESEDKSEKPSSRQDHSPVYSKDVHHPPNFTYLVSPYTYANGAASLPVSMANKIGIPTFFCHNGDHLTTPPPAHCGIPPYQIDPKTMGEFCLTRPSLYSFPNPQYAYPMLSPEMASTWHTPYSGPPFRPGYPSSLQINTSLSRFSPSLLPSVHQHVLNSHPHPALVSSGSKQDSSQESNHRYGRSSIEHHHNSKNSSSSIPSDSAKESIANDKKKPHIKKPLNAFMLYMKEMRAQVVAECTLKESAAINQILGRKWHALGREEQAKYYELARRERQLHMQMYPDWSSRTNATRGKKRKRKQEPNDGGNSMKKCRARYGLDQQNQWCKPCRRKKKCVRYKEAEESRDLENHGDESNLGSCGSVDDAQTPDDDTESLNQSMSSPGGLSGLSSLQSPSTSLASPINLLASPSTPNPIMSHHHDEHQMVQSLVNQLQRNKASGGWDGKHQSHQKSSNGIILQDDIKKEQQKQQQMANDIQIKTEPMDQSHNHPQQHHRLDPFLYDKLPILHRNPVGANPRDINNPLSVNQLTRRDFHPNMGGVGGYYSPYQKPLMAHPLAHHQHHSLAQFHAANIANFQLAAAAAAAQQAPGSGKDAGSSNGTHHRDDGNAISVI